MEIDEHINDDLSVKPDYPGLTIRIKAMVIDGMMMLVFTLIASFFFSLFHAVNDVMKIIVFLFIFLLYDPIFTSAFGGTIGHMVMGIKVKRRGDQTKNILFPLALIRFIFKSLLGIISLLTVNSDENKQAIHDMIVNSIVLYKNPTDA